MDATFTRKDTQYTLLFQRSLPHPPEKVWRVLTERKLLRQWFPCDIEGEWEAGASLRFTFLNGEGDDLPEEQMLGKVLVVDPPRLLEFSWGDHIIRCRVEAEGEGSKLIFSDSFDDAAWGARNAAGWESCLENLDLILDGAEAVKFVVETWLERFEYYRSKFEPQAGPQMGMPENYPDADKAD